MKRILISVTLLLSASQTVYGGNPSPLDDYQKRFSESLGAKGIETAKGSKIKDGKGKGTIDDTYMDTVIYNDIYDRRSHRGQTVLRQPPVSGFEASGIKLATPKSDYIAFATKQYKDRMAKEEAARKLEELKKKEKPKYFVGGYCSAVNRTEIVKASSFNIFDCLLDFGEGKLRELQVFTGIYPNYQKEILIGLPLYVTLPDGKRASMRGVVMSADKTSLNIANEVESYKIRRWVAKYGLTINNIAYKYAMMYMNDLRASKYNQQITFIDNQNLNGTTGTIPVQTTQIAPPDANDMLKMAGVELIGKLVALGAENILEDTEPLFTIYKGQRVWIEGVIDTDSTTMYGTFDKINAETKKSIQEENTKFINAGEQIIKQGGGTTTQVQLPTGGGSSSFQQTGTVIR